MNVRYYVVLLHRMDNEFNAILVTDLPTYFMDFKYITQELNYIFGNCMFNASIFFHYSSFQCFSGKVSNLSR